jgi:hypothetical protein
MDCAMLVLEAVPHLKEIVDLLQRPRRSVLLPSTSADYAGLRRALRRIVVPVERIADNLTLIEALSSDDCAVCAR